MGFPLRSNIFRVGTSEHAYFARFPVQVAVLFSPRDSAFGNAFRELFAHLDQLTGDEVAFFAVLDPPQDWLEIAADRDWWQKYRSDIGIAGYSYDDRALVNEIARLFGATWDEFPVLIVSNNLWSGESAICPTSQWDIENQLQSLTKLVQKWEHPDIHQIISTLEDAHGSAVRYTPTNGNRQFQITTFYRFLDMFTPQGQHLDLGQFQRLLTQTLNRIRVMFNEGLNRPAPRSNIPRPSRMYSADFPSQTDFIIDDAAGQLVAPATVADRARYYFEGMRYQANLEFQNADALDDQSIAMIEQAIRIGNLLERENFISLPNSTPFRDFTPAAQGIWKAIEREMNCSVIQAARKSRTIKMPDYYTRFDPTTLDENLIVIETPRKVNINQQDKKNPKSGKHVFLELGKGFYVTDALLGNSDQKLHNIINNCLGSPIPPRQLSAWKRLIDIRNKGSHIDTILEQEYQEALQIFSCGILESFLSIKTRMRR